MLGPFELYGSLLPGLPPLDNEGFFSESADMFSKAAYILGVVVGTEYCVFFIVAPLLHWQCIVGFPKGSSWLGWNQTYLFSCHILNFTAEDINSAYTYRSILKFITVNSELAIPGWSCRPTIVAHIPIPVFPIRTRPWTAPFLFSWGHGIHCLHK